MPGRIWRKGIIENMIAFLKYLRGYLRIRVWGFSPERFMNLCSNRNILLWDIVREGEVYYMCISLKGFRKLRDIARKTGTRVVICSRHGLPFFVPTLLSRKAFILGLLFAVAFWIWSSFYIWDIEIQGNHQITEDVFITFLKKEQVVIGMQKGALDIGTLEKEIRRQFSQITWISAKLAGTKLVIDVKENDAPIIVPREEVVTGEDLVASHGGVVLSMLVRKGVPKVAVGDVVEQGTVLVEGKVPVFQEDGLVRAYHYVRADADIVLEYKASFQDTLPFEHIQKRYTGRTKRQYFLRLGKREWRTSGDQPFLQGDSVVRSGRPLVFEKLSVPVFWGFTEYREYQNVEYDYTLEKAEYKLQEKLKAFLETLAEKGVQIIEKDVKIRKNKKGMELIANLSVIKQTGKEEAIQGTDKKE